MSRMTDERLAEIEAWFRDWAVQGPVEDTIDELLQALKADRKRIKELEAAEVAYESVRQDCWNLTEKVIPNLRAKVKELEALPYKAEAEAGGGSDYWKGWIDACRWIRQAALEVSDEQKSTG